MAAFPKDVLCDLVYGGVAPAHAPADAPGWTVVSDDIVDVGRWVIRHRMVFTDAQFGVTLDGQPRFYEARYEVGATEEQEMELFEDDPDPVECVEVFPVERVVTFYEPAPA